MSFESGSVGFRFFELVRPLPADAIDKFAEHAAPGISENGEGPFYGWVTSRHLMDRDIKEETVALGGYVRLDLLEISKKIPTSLLQAEMKMEEIARLAASGQAFIGRKEKSEMKKEIQDRMLPNMPLQLKNIPMAVRADGKAMFAAALSEKQMDLFVTHLQHAVQVPAKAQTPAEMAMTHFKTDVNAWSPATFATDVPQDVVSPEPGDDFLTWLWFHAEKNDGLVELPKAGRVGVLIEGPLLLVMEGGGAHETNLRKGNPPNSVEAKAGLMAGKKLRKCQLTFSAGDAIWTTNVDGLEFVFRGLKLPENEEKLDPVSNFQDRMFKIEAFREIFLELFGEFVALRNDKDKWSKAQVAMRTWVRDRKTLA